MTNMHRFRVPVLIAGFVSLVVIAGAAATLGPWISSRAVADAPPAEGKPASTATPGIPTWTKDNFGDDMRLRGDTVRACPLDSAGCTAIVSLLPSLDAADADRVASLLKPGANEPLAASGKRDMQIANVDQLRSALERAKPRFGTIAIGCPQANELGPEPGACDDRFVLAIDVTPASEATPGQRALAFVFVRNGDTFELRQAFVEAHLDVTWGGGFAGFNMAVPALAGSSPSLWYTPWSR